MIVAPVTVQKLGLKMHIVLGVWQIFGNGSALGMETGNH